jgi:hypothetical protein
MACVTKTQRIVFVVPKIALVASASYAMPNKACVPLLRRVEMAHATQTTAKIAQLALSTASAQKISIANKRSLLVLTSPTVAMGSVIPKAKRIAFVVPKIVCAKREAVVYQTSVSL